MSYSSYSNPYANPYTLPDWRADIKPISQPYSITISRAFFNSDPHAGRYCNAISISNGAITRGVSSHPVPV